LRRTRAWRPSRAARGRGARRSDESQGERALQEIEIERESPLLVEPRRLRPPPRQQLREQPRGVRVLALHHPELLLPDLRRKRFVKGLL